MADGSPRQKRRSPRSKLLMAAWLEHDGGTIPVTLRDLSADGALLEGDHDLGPGADIVFRKGDLAIAAKVAWADGRRAGIAFAMSLDPETVLRHIPAPALSVAEARKKRPGFHGRLSPEDRRIAEDYWGGPLPYAEN